MDFASMSFFSQYRLAIDMMLSRFAQIYCKAIKFSRFNLFTQTCA
jgi:hypothetical protein